MDAFANSWRGGAPPTLPVPPSTTLTRPHTHTCSVRTMEPPTGLLSLALYANIGYFVAMSAAHWVGFKVPVLFIYYDTPFHPYQDKIISFCAGTYAILNLAAARHRAVVPYVVASLALTTVGLSAINASDDLRKVLPAGASTIAYWLQTGLIGALTGMLAVLHVLSFAKNKSV